jgi:hypothetical protein
VRAARALQLKKKRAAEQAERDKEEQAERRRKAEEEAQTEARERRAKEARLCTHVHPRAPMECCTHRQQCTERRILVVLIAHLEHSRSCRTVSL